MGTPFIGEIKIWANNFSPLNWAYCNGSIVSISQFSGLFAVIGPTFGGNGQTTMALPDLRGRAPMGTGTGPGLYPSTIGGFGGAPQVSLTTSELPSHDHQVYTNFEGSKEKIPAYNLLYGIGLTDGNTRVDTYHSPDQNLVNMSSQAAASAGASVAHENRQPLLTMNFCIAMNGLFPSRS